MSSAVLRHKILREEMNLASDVVTNVAREAALRDARGDCNPEAEATTLIRLDQQQKALLDLRDRFVAFPAEAISGDLERVAALLVTIDETRNRSWGARIAANRHNLSVMRNNAATEIE